MMIGQIGWEKIDLIKALVHLVAILTLVSYVKLHEGSDLNIYIHRTDRGKLQFTCLVSSSIE